MKSDEESDGTSGASLPITDRRAKCRLIKRIAGQTKLRFVIWRLVGRLVDRSTSRQLITDLAGKPTIAWGVQPCINSDKNPIHWTPTPQGIIISNWWNHLSYGGIILNLAITYHHIQRRISNWWHHRLVDWAMYLGTSIVRQLTHLIRTHAAKERAHSQTIS